MKKTLFALALAALFSNPLHAQTIATVSGTAIDLPLPASVSVVSSPVLTPDTWVKIGPAWGPAQAWQFGFDSSKTAAVCAFDGLAKHQKPSYIVGPCRDVFILAKNGNPIYHVGGEFGYNVSDLSHSHPYYLARVGITVGPAVHGSLEWVSEKIPYVEEAANWNAPSALQYLGNISTVDAGGGPGVGVKPVYGAALKLSLPIDDVVSFLKISTRS